MTRPEVAITTIVDAPDLIIRRGSVEGGSGRPIVLFSSAGLEARRGERLEFIGMLGRLGRPILFVADPNRSWYGHGDVADRITREILNQMEDLGADSVDTIGNSMGAFGSIAFAERFPVRHALAFGPRFTPDARIVADGRLPKLLARYRDTFPFRTAEGGLSSAKAVLVLHGLHPPDLRHILAYEKLMENGHWVLPVARHEAALVLREKKVLFPVLSAFLGGKNRKTDALLTKAGASRSSEMTETVLERLEAEDRDKARRTETAVQDT